MFTKMSLKTPEVRRNDDFWGEKRTLLLSPLFFEEVENVILARFFNIFFCLRKKIHAYWIVVKKNI